MITWANVGGFFLYGWTCGITFSMVLHFFWKLYGVKFLGFWSGPKA